MRTNRGSCAHRPVRHQLYVPGILLLLLAGLRDPAWAQTNLPIDSFWLTNGNVYAIEESAGTVYVGGTFSKVAPYVGGFVRLDPVTGAPDLTLPRVDGTVYAAAPDGAGGWFLGGFFTRVGGVSRSNIAHILGDGRISAWNPSADLSVRALAVSGGIVYAGGDFAIVGGQARSRIAALDAATGAVTAWNPSASGGSFGPTVFALAASGNTVYVGGSFASIGGQPRNNVAAISAATGLASAWNPNPATTVFTIAVSGTTVYVGGSFIAIGGQPRNHIAALSAATGNATSWNPNADANVRVVAVSGATVYVGGVFSTIGGQSRSNLAALDAVSALATSWNPAPVSLLNGIYTLAFSPGLVYVGGQFTAIGGQARNNVAAVDATTGAATGWDPDAGGALNPTVYALGVYGGSVYAGGDFGRMGGQARGNIAALDVATGSATPWSPEASGGSPPLLTIAAAGGTVYAGGTFAAIGGQARNRIAALSVATGAATSWDPNADGTVSTLVVSAGTVYASGGFTTIGGQARNKIAALDGAGAATAWNPNANGGIAALRESGGLVYAGGSFTAIGGQTRNRVAALDAAGSATSWNPNVGAAVNDVVVSGGLAYLGGTFTTVNGFVPRNRIAAVDLASGTATSWNPNSDTDVYALAVGAGTIFAGGPFINIGGQTRRNLAGLSPVTGLATTWNPGVSSTVYALTVAGNRLYVGGDFMQVAKQQRRGFAAFCLAGAPSLLSAAGGSPNTIDLTWTGTGAPSYNVYRSRQPGGPYTLVGSTSLTTYSDSTVQGGVNYRYVIRAVDGCESDPSNEVVGLTSGSCVVPPEMEGAGWVQPAAGATCSLRVNWGAAQDVCGSGVSYSVYRGVSPTFAPSPATRVAAGLGSTSYTESGLAPSTTYYYIVRAMNLTTGGEDQNTIRAAGSAAACPSGPATPVTLLTVRSIAGENKLEWLNPSNGPVSFTRIRFRLDTFPANENDGTLLVDQPGSPGSRGTVPHAATNDTTYYYAAFVNSGSGGFSTARNAQGRPFDTAGPVKWAYSTGASALAPPGLGPLAVHVVSNDNFLHSMVKGSAGGDWPASWTPLSMNLPSQGRPSTVPVPIQTASRVVFVGSQDTNVYAIDADTGALLWRSALPGMVQAGPSGIFTMFGGAYDFILVGTRNGLIPNSFYALNVADGSVAWSYDGNDGVTDLGRIGTISGQAAVDYGAKRVYFASRAFGPAPDNRTVWCVDLGTGKAIWAQPHGDVDGGVALRGDRPYVGAFNGISNEMRALETNDGSLAWLFPVGGAVKGWVSPDRLTANLYFSTDDNRVFSLKDEGATYLENWSSGGVSLNSPSPPTFAPADTVVYVGGIGRLFRLDVGTGSVVDSFVVGDGTAIVGSPTLDLRPGFAYVGTDLGIVYAIQLP
jgi:outer membrane protein assembly factor BamB